MGVAGLPSNGRRRGIPRASSVPRDHCGHKANSRGRDCSSKLGRRGNPNVARVARNPSRWRCAGPVGQIMMVAGACW